MTIAAINQSQSGIVNLNIPILRSPTFQRIPLEFDNVELDRHMSGN